MYYMVKISALAILSQSFSVFVIILTCVFLYLFSVCFEIWYTNEVYYYCYYIHDKDWGLKSCRLDKKTVSTSCKYALSMQGPVHKSGRWTFGLSPYQGFELCGGSSLIILEFSWTTTPCNHLQEGSATNHSAA